MQNESFHLSVQTGEAFDSNYHKTYIGEIQIEHHPQPRVNGTLKLLIVESEA